MTRKDIEQNIIAFFSDYVVKDGMVLINKKINSSDHFADYEIEIGDLKYVLSVVFIKPNFLKANFYLKISSQKITDFINSIAENTTKEYFIANININSYLTPLNRNGIYQSPDKVDFYIDEIPINTIDDIERLVENVFIKNVYNIVKEEIIPKTNTLEKLDYLFNDLVYINNDKDKPLINSYTTYLVNQILSGSLLAVNTNRIDREILFKKYLNYSSKFQENEHLPIDIMRKVIKRFS